MCISVFSQISGVLYYYYLFFIIVIFPDLYNYNLLIHYLLSSLFYVYWIWTFVQLRCAFQFFLRSQGLFIYYAVIFPGFYNYNLHMHYLLSSLLYIYCIWTLSNFRGAFQFFLSDLRGYLLLLFIYLCRDFPGFL